MLLFLRSIADVVVVTFRPVVDFVSDVGKYPFFRLFVVVVPLLPSSNDSNVKSVFVNRGAVTLSREFRFSNAVLPSTTLLLLLPFPLLPLIAAAAVVTTVATDLEGGGATIPPT